MRYKCVELERQIVALAQQRRNERFEERQFTFDGKLRQKVRQDSLKLIKLETKNKEVLFPHPT